MTNAEPGFHTGVFQTLGSSPQYYIASLPQPGLTPELTLPTGLQMTASRTDDFFHYTQFL